jgi:hypothetical protein
LLGCFLTACLALGMHLNTDREAVAASWPSGTTIRAHIASVTMSSDGHALVALANGSKAFVPEAVLKRNPERLHHLIVAWRQGRPLTLYATPGEHKEYGRRIAIRDTGTPVQP